jgi:hypothetical protein
MEELARWFCTWGVGGKTPTVLLGRGNFGFRGIVLVVGIVVVGVSATAVVVLTASKGTVCRLGLVLLVLGLLLLLWVSWLLGKHLGDGSRDLTWEGPSFFLLLLAAGAGVVASSFAVVALGQVVTCEYPVFDGLVQFCPPYRLSFRGKIPLAGHGQAKIPVVLYASVISVGVEILNHYGVVREEMEIVLGVVVEVGLWEHHPAWGPAVERVDFHLFDGELLLAEDAGLLVDMYGWDGGWVGTVRNLVVWVEILEIHESSVLYFLQKGLLQGWGEERVAKTCPWVSGHRGV